MNAKGTRWAPAERRIRQDRKEGPMTDTASHRVEVTTTDQSGKEFKRLVEGDDTWVAASLRALADKLDPPPFRPGPRQLDPSAGSMVRRTPGAMVTPPPSGTLIKDPMSTR